MQTQGYFLAKDIVASYNSPEYPTSAMDGYAIRFEDQDLKELEIESINPAGVDDILTLTKTKLSRPLQALLCKK